MFRSRHLAIIFIVVVVLVGLSRLDLRAVGRAFAATAPTWAAAAALVNLLSVVVDAARWKGIVGGVRRVSIVTAIEGLLIGWVSNLVVPLKLGEGARAWFLAKREDMPIATAVSTVVLDRAVDAATLVLFATLTSLVVPLPPRVQGFRAWGLGVLAVLVCAVGIGHRWIRARQRRGAKVLDGTIGQVLHGFVILGQQHRLAGVMSLAMLTWFVRTAVIWCVMRSFHLMLPVVAAASVLVVVNLGIAAVAVPGNVGVFELSTVAGLALWGVPSETAASFGIALHALEVVPTLILGLTVRAHQRTSVAVIARLCGKDGSPCG